MNRTLIKFFLFIYLITLGGIFPCGTMEVFAQEIISENSIPVVELMVRDTLDLELHGPSSDIAFYTNGLVFLSNSKYHQKMIPDHITFGVIKTYFVPLEYIALESSIPLFANDNFPYSPAGMSFTRDYQKVYFTKTEDLHGRLNVEKIFEMQIIDGRASSQNQLAFTDDPSRYLHPAISMDESFMIFSSDRTPSSGGLDLFITKKTSNGWSKPENMGHSINSSSHEWYPYLDYNNNLYFSSAGHMGYGGYDVFVCLYNGSGWDNPMNMSSYINSEQDELGFSIHPNRHMAILSQVTDGQSSGEVFMIGLRNKASKNDISELLGDLIESGYTSGEAPITSVAQTGNETPITSTPLIFDEPVKETKTESEAVVQDPTALMNQVKSEPDPAPVEVKEQEADPNRLLFRVQILSSTKANSKPKVSIEGKTYTTFEYYYKGAYRITVGEFEDLSDANAFRTKCRNSGFDQAWVAAFRGKERETDPSVFKTK